MRAVTHRLHLRGGGGGGEGGKGGRGEGEGGGGGGEGGWGGWGRGGGVWGGCVEIRKRIREALARVQYCVAVKETILIYHNEGAY